MTEQIKQRADDYLKAQCLKRKDCLVLEMTDHYITDVKQAYIDGATENSIQWHKVSEELPKAEIGIHNVETYRVLKLNAYKNPVECYCSYNNRTQKFETVVDTKKSVYWKEIKDVVAWQEIPLVPEEVNAWLYPQIKE